MFKLKGINVVSNGERTECEINVNTAEDFNICVRFEKSCGSLEYADSINIEVNDSSGYISGFWERGSLIIEEVKEESK